MNVPKKIHQIYWDFTGQNREMSEKWLKYSTKVKSLHPDWEYKLWNEEDCEQLVKENLSEYAFNRYKDLIPICKCDFVRVLIIYVHGGFYLDMDVYLHSSLDVLKPADGYVFVESTQCEIPYVGNAAFGFKENHALMAEVLESAVNKLNLIEVEMFSDDNIIYTVLYLFGPHFWSGCMQTRDYRILPQDRILSDSTYSDYLTTDNVVFLPPQALLGWSKAEKGCIIGKHTTDGSWKKELEVDE